ncbi:pro-MCH isoform X2 [Salvelinus fontinalis]|uniref:pro-MCH isoform X2 n=1 Tax=Salvelinus fontinalis TaxID=8038 RepID=UPI0024862710|nr:pro-MCH isoform X2 [Salvelinus fontinalis]
MIFLYSVIFTLVLFSEFNTRSFVLAVPTGKLDEGRSEQESMLSILGEDTMSDNALDAPRFRREPVLDNGLGDEEDNTKIVILSDIGLKGHTRRGMNTAFSRALPVLPDRGIDHSPAEYSLKVERREADLEMLRCMIGRVYRPCWQA